MPIETTRQTGLAVMVSGAALFLAQMVLIQVFRLTPLRLLRLGMPLVLVSLLLLAFTASQVHLMLAMVLLGLGIGMVQPGFRSAVTFAVEPHEQGAAAGLANSIPGYGYIFGPALGTALYGLNPFSPYILACVVMLAGLAVLVLHPSTRAVQPATQRQCGGGLRRSRPHPPAPLWEPPFDGSPSQGEGETRLGKEVDSGFVARLISGLALHICCPGDAGGPRRAGPASEHSCRAARDLNLTQRQRGGGLRRR